MSYVDEETELKTYLFTRSALTMGELENSTPLSILSLLAEKTLEQMSQHHGMWKDKEHELVGVLIAYIYAIKIINCICGGSKLVEVCLRAILIAVRIGHGVPIPEFDFQGIIEGMKTNIEQE
jgi:hypothetical protein